MKPEIKEKLDKFHDVVHDQKVVNLEDKELLFEIVILSDGEKLDAGEFRNEENYILYEDLLEFEQYKRRKYYE